VFNDISHLSAHWAIWSRVFCRHNSNMSMSFAAEMLAKSSANLGKMHTGVSWA